MVNNLGAAVPQPPARASLPSACGRAGRSSYIRSGLGTRWVDNSSKVTFPAAVQFLLQPRCRINNFLNQSIEVPRIHLQLLFLQRRWAVQGSYRLGEEFVHHTRK